MRSPSVSPANASRVHFAAPSGTVSMWPVKQMGGRASSPPTCAMRLVRASANSWYSTRKPARSRIAPRCRAQARSIPGGLMVLNASSSRVRARGSIRAVMRAIFSRGRAGDPAALAYPGIERLHADGEGEREVEVALRDVEVQAVGHEEDADHQ